MKKLFTGIAVITLAAILFLNSFVNAYSAQHAILFDANTERVLYEKQSDNRSLIASTTKIMTALIICEQCNVLDRVRISKESVGIEGSSLYLTEGEVLTVQELLYGLMLRSGNDAATALAIYCGGTVEGFVALMNDKAHRLGLQDTHFENPHGLDAPNHFSTAKDLAILTAYAMNNPIFQKTVSTKEIKIGQRYLRNHNKLLWRYEGADGVKTGFTKAAGRILVSSAVSGGRRLIAVTINAPDDWNDHTAMLKKGFSEFVQADILKEGMVIGNVDVAGGTRAQVELIAAEDFSYALAKNESVSFQLKGSGFVYAPTVTGQNAGSVYILIDGKPVGSVPLVFGDTVEQITSENPSFLQRLFGRKES